MLDASRGVHLLGHDQRLGVEIERHHRIGAGCRCGDLDIASCGLKVGAGFDDRLQVLGPRATAAANNAHAVFGDELLVVVGQLLRLQKVDCTATLVLRQPSIGQNGNMLGRVRAQVPDRIVHLFRAGSAVQTDRSDVEHLQRGERRANLGAKQHGAGSFQRDLHLDGHVLSGFLQRVEKADQSGFRLKDVLTGLQQENINSALDECDRLFRVGGGHVVEGDVSQRR